MGTLTASDFSGGYNSFLNAWQLPDNQLQTATNTVVDNGAASPLPALGATVSTGLVGTQLFIAKVGGTWVGSTAAAGTYAYINNQMAYVIDGTATPYYTNGGVPETLGLTYPVSAPGAAIGAGTGITATAIVYYYSFVTALGQESGLSPASGAVSPANQSVDLTGVIAGPAGTTKRRIYRSNGSAIQHVAYINDNVTTTYTDTLATTGLGDAAVGQAAVGGAAPSLSLIAGPHIGRLFGVASSYRVYFSDVGAPGIWRATSYVTFPETITTIASAGSSLLVLMQDSAWWLDGSDASTFSRRRGSNYGSSAAHSLVDCGTYGLVYWTPQGIVAVTGGQFQLLTGTKLSKEEAATYQAVASTMLGGYWRDQYYLFTSIGLLIYNFLTGTITKSNETVSAVFSDRTGDALYVQDGASAYVWQDATPSSYRTQTIRTKDFNPGSLDGAMHTRKVSVEHSGDFTVRFIQNGTQHGVDQSISRASRGRSFVWLPMDCWGPRLALEFEGTGTLYSFTANPEEAIT